MKKQAAERDDARIRDVSLDRGSLCARFLYPRAFSPPDLAGKEAIHMWDREGMDPKLVDLLREALASPEWLEMEADLSFLQAEQQLEPHIWRLEQTSKLWQRRFLHEGNIRRFIQDHRTAYDLFRLAWAANGLCNRYTSLLYYRQGVMEGARREKKALAP